MKKHVALILLTLSLASPVFAASKAPDLSPLDDLYFGTGAGADAPTPGPWSGM